MRSVKYIAIVILLSASITACKDRSNATLGGTQDTVAKTGTGDPNNTHAADSAKKDSANNANAAPDGHGASDTLDSRPVH